MTTTETPPRFTIVTAAATVLLDGPHRVTLEDVRALPVAALDDLDLLALVDVEDEHADPSVVGTTAAGDLARARVPLERASEVAVGLPLIELYPAPVPMPPPTPAELLEVRQRACALVEAYLKGDRDGLAVLVGGTGTEAAHLAIETAWVAASVVTGAARATGGEVAAIMASMRDAAQREHDDATR